MTGTLIPEFTFETLVLGPRNRFAHAAAVAVAEAPGAAYNPLFIYGGPRSGRTRLLHALGNYARLRTAGGLDDTQQAGALERLAELAAERSLTVAGRRSACREANCPAMPRWLSGHDRTDLRIIQSCGLSCGRPRVVLAAWAGESGAS
jgi:hypothetical protein